MNHIHVILNTANPEEPHAPISKTCDPGVKAESQGIRLMFGRFEGNIATFEVVLSKEQAQLLSERLYREIVNP